MNFPVLNRDASGTFRKPADGWYHIAPLGEFPHSSGVMQVLDAQAAQSIVNRFTEDSKATNFGGLLVDFDHSSYDTNRSSQAAGWVTELANRDDGIWAKVRWTTTGDSEISGGNYRFVSPVWLKSDMQEVGKNRMRPIRLDSLGLTNMPNIKGMVPLSNRQGDTPPQQKPQQKEKSMKSVLLALGLAAEASEDSGLAAVQTLKNRAEKAEADLIASRAEIKTVTEAAVPLKNRVAELDGSVKALTETVVEADLNRLGNRFKPESRETWKAQLIANRAGAIALLESIPEPAAAKGADGKPALTVLNRNDGKTPAAGGVTFQEIVANRMAGSKETKSQAVDFAMTNHQAEYKAWLDAGGGVL